MDLACSRTDDLLQNSRMLSEREFCSGTDSPALRRGMPRGLRARQGPRDITMFRADAIGQVTPDTEER